MLTNDSLFSIQADVIRKVAARGILRDLLGRCADYLLDGTPGLLKVFVHASLEFRKERIMRLYNVSAKDVEGVIRRTDRQRAKYYDFYTAQEWGQAKNYNICLDTSYFTPDGISTDSGSVCQGKNGQVRIFHSQKTGQFIRLACFLCGILL